MALIIGIVLRLTNRGTNNENTLLPVARIRNLRGFARRRKPTARAVMELRGTIALSRETRCGQFADVKKTRRRLLLIKHENLAVSIFDKT